MATVAATPLRKQPAQVRVRRVLFHNRNLPIGLAVLLLTTILAVAAPWIAPHDPLDQDLSARLHPPFWVDGGDISYPLGTDQLGRDVLSRMLYGARVSLAVGLSVAIVAGTLGVLLGLVAGYKGGWADITIMRLADAQQALPGILLAIIVVAMFGASIVVVIAVLSVTSWPLFARIVYSSTRSLKERDFVQAAVALGAGTVRILIRHLWPNMISTCLVLGALQVGRVILAEASLSFLGLGVPPPAPSWGGMVSDGLTVLRVAPGLATAPGVAILLTVLGANLLGDGLRQATDPKLRHLGLG